MTFTPPTDEMMFILRDVLDIGQLASFKDDTLDMEMTAAILEEGGKLAADVLAPLNHSGDQQGCTLFNGEVTTPKGFKEAYNTFIENGWNGVPFEPEYGGQGLPWALTFALYDMWQAGNMAFCLCPMLTQAGVEALQVYGTDHQKTTYLEKLVSGEWTGTMQLTEPQAGTDLGALRTKAEPQGDGTYKIFGQKIYITYGEHDWTENIIHMVLAKLPDAPEGSRGISMFLVPKFLEDGTRNDAYAVGLEHKLGIHASPTCTMQYGDNGGAVGYLIGAENEGLKNMFVMMNNARLAVGLQGVALGERAYQHAKAYAADRIQSAHIADRDGGAVAIEKHPDVRRMLLSMQAKVCAGRLLALDAGIALDKAKEGDTAALAKVNLLTPIVKAWCTDMANDVAGTGVQVHGGMGFIEETGAAQFVRDARILTIYEGTNGIQAQDLYGQKTVRDKGAATQAWLAEARKQLDVLQSNAHKATLSDGLDTLDDLMKAMLSYAPAEGAAVSVPYLQYFGTLAGAVLLGQAAHAQTEDAAMTAQFAKLFDFYMLHVFPVCKGLSETVINGASIVNQD